MTRMPTAHLICGPIGSGKTAFARRLEVEIGALRFTHDEWMVILYGQDPPHSQFPDYFQRVTLLINSTWPRCLELGLDVILDLNLWKRSQRDEVRRMVAARAGTSALYWLGCQKEVAWKRVKGRNGNSTDLYIAPETFESLWPQIEPLGQDEDHIVISS